jgi:hypothetical protein
MPTDERKASENSQLVTVLPALRRSKPQENSQELKRQAIQHFITRNELLDRFSVTLFSRF